MEHQYVGLDVHQSSTVPAVHDEKGRSRMESILATEAQAIRDFLKGLRGTIHVTFEEGTQAAWLYEIQARGGRSDRVQSQEEQITGGGEQGRPGGCAEASRATAM